MNKDRFHKIFKSVHKISKFKNFAEVVTYTNSPDHVLQSDV